MPFHVSADPLFSLLLDCPKKQSISDRQPEKEKKIVVDIKLEKDEEYRSMVQRS